jgi:hypothetical protein
VPCSPCEAPVVHVGVDLIRSNENGGLEERRVERVEQAAREVRAILVDDADHQIFRFCRSAGRDRVDGKAEGVDHKNEHHRVGPDAPQLLQGRTADIDEMGQQPLFAPPVQLSGP